MDPLAVQRTRYLLRARFRLSMKGPRSLIGPACAHALRWLGDHPIFGPIAARLAAKAVQYDTQFAAFAKKVREGEAEVVARMEAATTEEHAALCLAAVRRFSEEPFEDQESHDRYAGWISEGLTGEAFEPTESEVSRAYEVLRDVAIDGLYDYLDEQLDARNVMYSLLLKYQRRSEWFNRDALRQIAATGTAGQQIGERSLAIDLQRYVFDQGVDFTVEPSSTSGEPDLVLRDSDERHVVIDAKYVASNATGSSVRTKIASGLHQVARYCEDFQEPAGFLVVFYDNAIKPRLPLEVSDGLQYLCVRSINVYIVLVNLFEAPSASKAGTAQELVISRDQLLKEVQELAVPEAR